MMSSLTRMLSHALSLGPDLEGENGNEEAPASRYLPSVQDVIVVKAMLLKGKYLPIEIVDLLVDHAEYWPHTTAAVTSNAATGPLYARANNENRFLVCYPCPSGELTSGPLTRQQIRTTPLGFVKDPHPKMDDYHRVRADPISLKSEHDQETWQDWIGLPDKTILHPARKIVFTLRSHDQGWGGQSADHGTYHGSWTWFDVGLERFDREGACTLPAHAPFSCA